MLFKKAVHTLKILPAQFMDIDKETVQMKFLFKVMIATVILFFTLGRHNKAQ